MASRPHNGSLCSVSPPPPQWCSVTTHGTSGAQCPPPQGPACHMTPVVQWQTRTGPVSLPPTVTLQYAYHHKSLLCVSPSVGPNNPPGPHKKHILSEITDRNLLVRSHKKVTMTSSASTYFPGPWPNTTDNVRAMLTSTMF